MKITPIQVTVGDVSDNYADDHEGGVTGLDGKLNIRPPYQRESSCTTRSSAPPSCRPSSTATR